MVIKPCCRQDLKVPTFTFYSSHYVIASFAVPNRAFVLLTTLKKILVFLFIAIARIDAVPASENGEKKGISFEDIQDEFHITEREFEVILQIKKGLTNKEIAYNLNISVNTVNNHIANIFSKTGVRSRIDLLNLLQEMYKRILIHAKLIPTAKPQ